MFHDQPNPTERLDAMPRHHSSAPTWPPASTGISTPYPLLDTFARKNYDLIAMLEAGVSMDQLTHYANNDAAIEQLRRIHTMGLLGLSIRAMEARHIAINKLIDTIQREDLPVRELRLCLTMLIRAGAQRLLDGSKIPEVPLPEQPTPPDAPSRPSTPRQRTNVPTSDAPQSSSQAEPPVAHEHEAQARANVQEPPAIATATPLCDSPADLAARTGQPDADALPPPSPAAKAAPSHAERSEGHQTTPSPSACPKSASPDPAALSTTAATLPSPSNPPPPLAPPPLPSHDLTISPPHDLTTSRSHHLTISPPHDLTTSRPHHLTFFRPHHLTFFRPHHLTPPPTRHSPFATRFPPSRPPHLTISRPRVSPTPTPPDHRGPARSAAYSRPRPSRYHSHMDESPPALCPRCGYDQSGIVATWAEACPLEGICSECGYAFAWRQICDPAEKALPGFIEHCRRRWIVPSAFRTLLWTIVPWWFWSKVKMHHRIVPRRWLVWLAVTVLGLYAVNVVASGFLLFAWEQQEYQRLHNQYSGFPAYMSRRTVPELGTHQFVAAAVHGPFLFRDERMISYMRLSQSSPRPSSPRMSFSWLGISYMPLISCFAAAMSTWIAGFLLAFGETRARLRVRKMHVMRAYAFSLAVIPAFVLLQLLGTFEFGFRRVWQGRDVLLVIDDVRTGPIGLGMAIGWMLIWWWVALGRGFRLRGAWYHALILAFAGVLGGAVVMMGVYRLDELVTPYSSEVRSGNFWQTHAQ